MSRTIQAVAIRFGPLRFEPISLTLHDLAVWLGPPWATHTHTIRPASEIITQVIA